MEAKPNKHWKTTYFLLLTMVLGMASSGLIAGVSEDKEKLDKLVSELQQANKELENQQTRKSQNEQKLRDSEVLLGNIRKDLRKARNNLASIEKDISKLEKEKTGLQNDIARQQKALRKDIIKSYSTGRQEYFKVLLNQEDPDKMARLITYYNYFHKARNTRIETFQNSILALESVNLELQERYSDTKNIEDDLLVKQNMIRKEQENRNRLLEQVNNEITNQEQKISRLATARDELDKLIKRVGDIMSDINNKLKGSSFKSNKGEYKLPAQGKVISKYRSNRAEGRLRSNGIIIAAKQGDEVVSIHHGRVVFSDWLRGFGLLTIIDHGEGYMTLYGHNESLLKETGDWVSSGDIIATAGNSGGQEKSGLYFEIRQNGKPTNPLAWCKPR